MTLKKKITNKLKIYREIQKTNKSLYKYLYFEKTRPDEYLLYFNTPVISNNDRVTKNTHKLFYVPVTLKKKNALFATPVLRTTVSSC